MGGRRKRKLVTKNLLMKNKWMKKQSIHKVKGHVLRNHLEMIFTLIWLKDKPQNNRFSFYASRHDQGMVALHPLGDLEALKSV